MKVSQNDIRHFISCNFFLDKKVPKNQEITMLSPRKGLPTPAVFSSLRAF